METVSRAAAPIPSTIADSSPSVTTSGGEIWKATPRRKRVITPWRRAAVTAAMPAVGFAARSPRRARRRLRGRRSARPPRPEARASGSSRSREDGLELRRALDEALALEDVEVDERGHARSRVPGVRAAVQERRRGFVPERRAHAAAHHDGAERHVARADPLRARHQIGREAVSLAAEPAPEPSEARDHLVCNEQHVALAADSLDSGPVAVRWWDHPAGADHRLADECGCAAAELVEDAGEVGRVVVLHLGDVADERAVAVADAGIPESEVP